ncbi:hypothetical protein M3Y94_01049000 [Aphelenchoides besseyi]|nr:hypothetical protein M3Y94_01049000 [Aphelenchoides besseyi]KAI6224071.1 hypothetical protein M3Y95_00844500 [Aphelenchoides besseyi]
MATCFPAPNGTPIVDMDQTVPLRNELLFIHWFLNAAIGISAFVLNCLLFYLIQTKSEQMNTMRPLLNSSCIIDLVLSFTNTMAGPFLNTSHGHFICFWNGIFPTSNRHLVALTVSIIGWFTIGSWGFLTPVFLYRLNIVKTGNRPQGFLLGFYIFLGVLALATAMFTAFNIYISPVEWFRLNAVKILRNSGYDISPNCIVGAHASESKMGTYTNYFTGVMLISYGTIIYTEIVRRMYLRHLYSRMSNATKRMHRDMNRTFMALAMCPVITSVFPSVYINYTIGSCQHFPIPMVIHSLIVVTTPLINACTTLFFVRPYRRTLLKWFRLIDKNARVRDGTTDIKPASQQENSNTDQSSLQVF